MSAHQKLATAVLVLGLVPICSLVAALLLPEPIRDTAGVTFLVSFVIWVSAVALFFFIDWGVSIWRWAVEQKERRK
jgi:hypothetical protein